MALLKTPLHQKHKQHNATSVSFCGWDMPMFYDSILKEHEYCRNETAIFDTSHMGELFFDGDLNISGINEATSIDVVNLKIGKCKYGFLLNEDGGVIDDLIIYKLSSNKLMLVVNASRIDVDYKTISSRLSSGSLSNKSNKFAKIDIQGKYSLKILQKYLEVDISNLSFFSFIETTIFNKNVIVSKTGYTGELGFEIYTDCDTVITIWDKLIEDGAKPAGLGARDLLRLEMGYSLYGNELTQDISPVKANLVKFLDLKRDFIGATALKKEVEIGVKKLIIPFKTTSKKSARKGFEVFQNNKKIGVVTSGSYSQTLGCSIGLALVDTEFFCDKDDISIKDTRGLIKAKKVSLPFIKIK
jgi:aminomethyltransferase